MPDGEEHVHHLPEFEAMAFACLEQYQYCAPGLNHCTDWSSHSRGADKLAACVRATGTSSNSNSAMADEVTHLFYAFIAEWVSVYRSLLIRTTELQTIPFIWAESWRLSRTSIFVLPELDEIAF